MVSLLCVAMLLPLVLLASCGGNSSGDTETSADTSAGLAYGLKSMAYFTWFTTGFCEPEFYAIISPYGEKTDIYDDVALYPEATDARGFIVSHMRDRENGREYVMLVNKNFNDEVSAAVSVSSAVHYLYNCTNGTYEEIDISSGSFELSFAPGAYVLLAVGQHDNIVDCPIDRGANLAEGKPVSVHAVNPGAGFYAYCVTDGLRDNSELTA